MTYKIAPIHHLSRGLASADRNSGQPTDPLAISEQLPAQRGQGQTVTATISLETAHPHYWLLLNQKPDLRSRPYPFPVPDQTDSPDFLNSQ